MLDDDCSAPCIHAERRGAAQNKEFGGGSVVAAANLPLLGTVQLSGLIGR
jgi:hypothetical protein